MDSLRHTTGFINVNKRAGASSAQEVAAVKKLAKVPCGHMGTLDPMASGVLPVAIGKAARLFDYFLSKHKTYVADFMFGVQSDTLDTTGEVKYNTGAVPSKQQILTVLPQFAGEIMQVPPMYSAKNVNGKRGYQLARQGEVFTLPPKKVTIYSIELLGQPDTAVYRFEIECGGGTYIRSLARDIAASLGTTAVMSALVRTQSGVFSIKDSVATCDLDSENFENYIIKTDSVISLPSYNITSAEEKKFLNGVPLPTALAAGDYKIYIADGTFYGIGVSDGEILKLRTKLW